MSLEEQQIQPHVESSSTSSEEELQHMTLKPLELKKRNRSLSKQLSMSMTNMYETPGDIAWERRRRQIQRQERGRRNSIHNCDDLTDEDLNELKGCIELGFGFNEEDGQKLCNTLPALDLYFAVNRQLSPVSTPHSRASSHGGGSSSFGSPMSGDCDSWKICSPGEIKCCHIHFCLLHL